jgi:uncharacterized membrane protein
MMEKIPNLSVTGHPRTSHLYWYVLVVQVVVGTATLLYLGVAALEILVLLTDLITGLILAVAALVSVAAYPSLFKDAIYVNRANFSWKPRWWRYFAVGFGITFLAYYVVVIAARHPTVVPVVLLVVLVASSLLVSAIYLYNRHRYVGIP